ncbi:hypothetical protein ANO11243_025110 [Dothideomycetidae sp. 11243]|nr:hypothetical protein ANO11243_025110 [fungal sp. No.11243]
MARLLHLVSAPFILVLSIPLTSFAVFTTLLAIATLLVRVSVVYVELALAIIQSAVLPNTPQLFTSSLAPNKHSSSTTSLSRNHHRRPPRHRRTSSSSTSSALHTPGFGPTSRNQSLASLINGQSATPMRDYESVGGWRLTSDNAEDEALWTGINSRLELPALTLPSPSARFAAPPPPPPPPPSSGITRRASGYAGKSQGSPTEGGGAGRRRSKYWSSASGTESPEGYFSSYLGGGGGGSAALESPALVMTTGRGVRSNEGSRGASRRSSISLVRLGKESSGGSGGG